LAAPSNGARNQRRHRYQPTVTGNEAPGASDALAFLALAGGQVEVALEVASLEHEVGAQAAELVRLEEVAEVGVGQRVLIAMLPLLPRPRHGCHRHQPHRLSHTGRGAPEGLYEELLGAEPLAGSHDPLRVGTVILVFFESARASVGDDPDEIAFDADAASFAAILGRARDMDVVTKDVVEPTPWSRAFLVRDPDS
jgi:hypothetical protein